MREPTREELEELAAMAYVHGRLTRKECQAGRCGAELANFSGFTSGHAAGMLVALLGGLDEPPPPWVLNAIIRCNAKTQDDIRAREHASEVN